MYVYSLQKLKSHEQGVQRDLTPIEFHPFVVSMEIKGEQEPLTSPLQNQNLTTMAQILSIVLLS